MDTAVPGDAPVVNIRALLTDRAWGHVPGPGGDRGCRESIGGSFEVSVTKKALAIFRKGLFGKCSLSGCPAAGCRVDHDLVLIPGMARRVPPASATPPRRVIRGGRGLRR